jgi:hypothetical protein
VILVFAGLGITALGVGVLGRVLGFLLLLDAILALFGGTLLVGGAGYLYWQRYRHLQS